MVRGLRRIRGRRLYLVVRLSMRSPAVRLNRPLREVAADRTQGVPNSTYRSFPTRLEAYRSFQLSLVLGVVRVLPPRA